MWPSNALQDFQIPSDIDISHSKEWVVSTFMIGAGLVPWFAGNTKKRRKIINQKYHTAASFQYIGKKRTLTCVSLPFIAGWLLLLLAKNSAMLLMGRCTTIHQCPSVQRMSLKVHHWLLWWNVFIGCPRLLCRDSRDQIPGSTGVPDAGYGVPGNALCQHQLLH